MLNIWPSVILCLSLNVYEEHFGQDNAALFQGFIVQNVKSCLIIVLLPSAIQCVKHCII